MTFKVWSKSFSRLLTSLSFIAGIYSTKNLKRLSDSFPFFNTSDLDSAALKLILANVMSFSILFSCRLAPITDVVVIVMLSINVLIIGCVRSDLFVGPIFLQLLSAYSLFRQKCIRDSTTNNYSLFQLIIFTKPSARAGYDTRSIFKRSLTGLNSEFSFS